MLEYSVYLWIFAGRFESSLQLGKEQSAQNVFFFLPRLSQLKSSQTVEVKSFKIEGEGANTIFTVDRKGDLFVTRSLDREEKSSYHLTAKMYDGNNKLIEDSGDFVVQVTDINDNIPVFSRTYNGSIMERSMIGEYCQKDRRSSCFAEELFKK